MSHPVNSQATPHSIENETPSVAQVQNTPEPKLSANTLTRVVAVSICGSLEELSTGGQARATWQPLESKHVQVFGLDSHNELGIESGTALNSLRNATILNARLLESKSTFPIPLGVNVSCLPKNEITETGDRYTYCVLPKSTTSQPYGIFKASADIEESQQWRSQYKEYNAGNLETQGVLVVKACPYVFVKDSHPIIAVLRHNTELIGAQIDNQPKIDNEWYKVSRTVLNQCCNALRSHVLSKIATHDLTSFQVSIERPGQQDWLDLNDLGVIRAAASKHIHKDMSTTEQNSIEDAEAHRFTTTPYEYHARIELTYELEH
jgi:hypothetical protein